MSFSHIETIVYYCCGCGRWHLPHVHVSVMCVCVCVCVYVCSDGTEGKYHRELCFPYRNFDHIEVGIPGRQGYRLDSTVTFVCMCSVFCVLSCVAVVVCA